MAHEDLEPLGASVFAFSDDHKIEGKIYQNNSINTKIIWLI